ncbi:MAG: hypothetical protein ABIR54_03105 [Burkholderiaceae bacterium]|jgi:hypothetical protein
MLKFLLPLAASVALAAQPALAGPAAAEPAPVAEALCTSVNPFGGDMRVVTCRVPAGRAHRFTANFGGGHDDTSATLSATLDGQATNCDADSKMSLFGEDGDVSLRCRVAAGDATSGVRTLVVTVLWSHAQYRNFVFAAEQAAK